MADKDNLADSEEEAVTLGQQLLDNGFIIRVSTTVSSYAKRYGTATEKRRFKAGDHFYRFVLEACCPSILYVMVIGARNLKSVDFGSDNDPFVKLNVGYQEKRTSVIMNADRPVWSDEIHTFGVVDTLSEHLRLTVMDYNEFAPNEQIGSAEVSLVGVETFPDSTSLQEAVRRWRERSEESILEMEGSATDHTDMGWINVTKKGKVTGQVRLALMLRDYEAREKERFRHTLQPYKLHCHIFGIEGVKERGGNLDHWIGANLLHIRYLSRVTASCDEVTAKTPWVSKRRTGDADFPEENTDKGVRLCLDIEANYLSGAVNFVVQQKLPTDQDLVAHSLGAIRVPLDQIPVLSDLDRVAEPEEPASDGCTDQELPVPKSYFHLMDGARRKFELDVQNGRLVAAVWLEMQANNVIGPWIEEKLAMRPYALSTRLRRTSLQESLPVGVERMYASMMDEDAFIMHAVYEEMLYSRVEIKPWQLEEVAGNSFLGFKGRRLIKTRLATYTITGITKLGNCQVEEKYYMVDKQPGGYRLHIVIKFFGMPFCDKFLTHVSVIVFQDLSDPYTSHVDVTNEVDFSLDGGPPQDIREELLSISNASCKQTFYTWCNVVRGAVQGSRREKEMHKECAALLFALRLKKKKLRTILLFLAGVVLLVSLWSFVASSSSLFAFQWSSGKGESTGLAPLNVCLESSIACKAGPEDAFLERINSTGR